MRVVLRIAEWAGFVFCVLASCLFASSGQVGFSVAFSVLGTPYLWLLAGAPRLPVRRLLRNRDIDHSRPLPIDPAWLTKPYADPTRCYGCGLAPEVMSPHQWVLCFWCNELRVVLKSRAAWPGLMI